MNAALPLDKPDESRPHLRGVGLVLLSTLFFALSGTFTKSISADAWAILGWRGFVGGVIIVGYVVLGQRREGRPLSLRLGRIGWLLAVVNGLSGVVFIASFKLTSVANVVVIYALTPFIAAVLARLLFREPLVWRTILASGVCLVGVWLTVSGGVAGAVGLGDLLAVGMTVGCAIFLVLVRRHPEAPSVLAGGVGALILVPFALLLGDLSAITPRDAFLMTLFGFSFAAAIITWTEGAKLIPAAESGLLGAAEIPIAAVLAAALLRELPTAAGIVGGLVVLAAVFGHAMADLRRAGSPSPVSAERS